MDALMPRIHVLSDLLVNKIAAGEVIERPASVVKELVENSLDSGARRIEIAIEDGGRRLIRVVDDGGGMDAEDLALCVRPHATSKIQSEEDLFSIRTMGFRGEALPSIGAVSQLRVTSRQTDSDEAYSVQVTGERIEPATAAAGPPGTTVEVRELFFNVPARQKFLRTAQTEMGHITEQLARIALVAPQVEFRLTHNNRLVHHLRPAEGMRPRIADFYGKELADALLDISRSERGLAISGYVSSPVDSRSSAKWQYIFLNGRFIRDRFIGHALREAYRGLMEANRHPVIFLGLHIDPAAVDVNVHPTKIEVRWRDSNMLYSQVLSAMRDRFLNADLTPTLQTAGRTLVPIPEILGAEPGDSRAVRFDAGGRLGAAVAPADASAGDDDAAEIRRRQIRASIAEYFKRAQQMTVAPAAASPGGFRGGPQTTPQPGASPDDAAAPSFHQPASALAADRALDGMTLPRMEPAADLTSDHAIQLHRTYLVAETADGMVIIDQHALHERILFEQLAERIARGPLESQRMLIPETLDVSADHVAVIETYADTLGRLGFELTPYGAGTIAVHAAPTLLREDRLLEFLRDLLDRLAMRSAPASTELLINDLLSMMACKAAVKAGDTLTDGEIRALLAQRHRVERSSNCPHGRPTSLRLTLRDLERQFKRT